MLLNMLQNTLSRSEICFGSWLQSLQSMIDLLLCNEMNITAAEADEG